MRYAEPSIIEALCEFVFTADTPWDFTVFGRFDAELGGRLPHRDQVEVMDLSVRNLGGEITQAITKEPRVRFFSEHRTQLAQVGRDLVTANVLPPYPHWQNFRAFVLETLRAYVAAARPLKIDRMTLRYIDRIAPPPKEFGRLGDWMRAGSAFIPSYMADSELSAMSRVEKQLSGGSDVVTVVHRADEDGAPFILVDTELAVRDLAQDEATVGPHLDRLHQRVVEIFEACITDKTRELLKPEGTQ